MTESFPFDNDTLVFKVMNKMFALASLERQPLTANLKCDPERSLELRAEYDGLIIPGYHMNKQQWNTVNIDGSIADKLIFEWIDHSYDLVFAKLTKKLQKELSELPE